MNQKNPKIPKQRTGYRGGLRVYTGKEKVGVKTLIERERKKRERWWRRGNNGSRSRQRVFSSGFLRKKKKKRGFCTSKTVIQIAHSVLSNENPHPRVIPLRFPLDKQPRGGT